MKMFYFYHTTFSLQMSRIRFLGSARNLTTQPHEVNEKSFQYEERPE